MEGILLILVAGWLIWKYYTAVVAKPPKEVSGNETATYDRYDDHLNGFPYRQEADGSIVVLTATGEVRYQNWKAFDAAMRLDYRLEEDARLNEQQAELLRRQKLEQTIEAERLREVRCEQEREAERLRQRQREQEQEAETLRQQQQQRLIASSRENEDWWTVLNVPQHAGADAIQRAYRQKMKQCHPDRVAGLAAEFNELAERQAKRLNEAYRKATQARRLP